MYKKSSLGRRSSMMNSGRLSMSDKNSSKFIEGKKSFIPRPSFAPKCGRSSSADRDLNISSVKKSFMPGSLQRSKSQLNLSRTSTPCFTPVQHRRQTGSMYSRPSEGGNRHSSLARSAKKESRPIQDKTYLEAAQHKVQDFFRNRAPEILDKGFIKPITIPMFVDVINFLVAKHDRTFQLDRKNPSVESIQSLCKIFSYRGKADKSWTKTLNAPHSWPYVISFVLWFVELYYVAERLDTFQAMYPDTEQDEIDLEESDYKLKLWVPHLLKGFSSYTIGQDDRQEMHKFLEEYKHLLGIDEDELKNLQAKYNALQEELNSSLDVDEKRRYTEMKDAWDHLQCDQKGQKDYAIKTEYYISQLDDKYAALQGVIDEHEIRILEAKSEAERLKTMIVLQEMSQEEKIKIEGTIASLKREIQNYKDEIDEYKNVMYEDEIELVAAHNVFQAMVKSYNKDILLNHVNFPELKDVEIVEGSITHIDSEERFEQLDIKLKSLKQTLQQESQEIEKSVNLVKNQLEMAENEMISTQDQLDHLSRDRQKLESEINSTKKAMQNESDQFKRVLEDIEEKIEEERKKLHSQYLEEEQELAKMKKEKEDLEKAFNEYVEKTTTSLRNRQDDIVKARNELAKITEEELADRKYRISELIEAAREKGLEIQ